MSCGVRNVLSRGQTSKTKAKPSPRVSMTKSFDRMPHVIRSCRWSRSLINRRPSRHHSFTLGLCWRSYISVFAACHFCKGVVRRSSRNSDGGVTKQKLSNSTDSPNCFLRSRLTAEPETPLRVRITKRYPVARPSGTLSFGQLRSWHLLHFFQ